MFTQCPHCQAQFKLTAQQLGGARGLVRCRRCFEIFNAIQTLHDGSGRIVTPPAAAPARGAGTPYQAAGAWLASRAESAKPASEAGPAAKTVRDDASIPDSSGDDASEDDPPPFGGDREDDDTVSADVAPPSPEPPAYLSPFSDGSAGTAHRVRPARQGFWLMTTLAGALALPAQYLYFMRDTLAQQPEWRPWVEYLCRWTGCTLPLLRDTARIELLARDVVTHPRVPGALLINTAWVNRAAHTQPFPTLKVTLSGLNGRKVAMRHFRPEEYLGEGMSLASGMVPDEPVHVVLEVKSPAREVTSFEFDFL